MKWLIDFLAHLAQWLHDFFLFIPRKVYALLCDGLVTVVQAIPVPSFFSDAGANLSAIPSGVAFFGSAFRIGDGLSIVLTAYLLRFLIRRIPVIG
jgi:hypothetical protein